MSEWVVGAMCVCDGGSSVEWGHVWCLPVVVVSVELWRGYQLRRGFTHSFYNIDASIGTVGASSGFEGVCVEWFLVPCCNCLLHKVPDHHQSMSTHART